MKNQRRELPAGEAALSGSISVALQCLMARRNHRARLHSQRRDAGGLERLTGLSW